MVKKKKLHFNSLHELQNVYLFNTQGIYAKQDSYIEHDEN